MKKVGLYIHIPFCKGKCSYCSFISLVKGNDYIDRYLKALERELEIVLDDNIAVDTLYIGGGTPSVVSVEQIGKIVDTIKKSCVYVPREFTVECNPESIDRTKLLKYRDIGVTRISVGVQSLNDSVLRSIGRLHDSKKAINVVADALNIGFDVSVDMILGLPDSTIQDIDCFVDTFCKMGVQHISAYGLKVEEGTRLFRDVERGKIVIPDEDAEADQYDYLEKKLRSLGYNRYEVSNFSLPNKESIHNTKYWEMDEYIGVGASAHSFFDSKRYYNTSDVDKYIESLVRGDLLQEEEEKVDENALFEETVMLGLRLEKGISIDKLNRLICGDFLEKYSLRIERVKDFINIDNGRIKIKPIYMHIMNSIIIKLLYD